MVLLLNINKFFTKKRYWYRTRVPFVWHQTDIFVTPLVYGLFLFMGHQWILWHQFFCIINNVWSSGVTKMSAQKKIFVTTLNWCHNWQFVFARFCDTFFCTMVSQTQSDTSWLVSQAQRWPSTDLSTLELWHQSIGVPLKKYG